MAFTLSARELDRLIDGLEDFHRNYGDLSSLLDAPGWQRLAEAHRAFVEALTDGQADAGERIAAYYLDLDLPFHLLMGSFNQLKNALMQIQTARSSGDADPFDLYAGINRLLEAARQQAARRYLDHESRRSEPLCNAQMQNKLLIRLYRDWLQRVNRALAGC